MGLDLEVTRRCNLRCDYCFVGWSRGWTDELPREVALQVVEEGAGLFDQLHVTGGEPFVYRPIWEVIEAALASGYEGVFLNSNGTVLPEGAVRRLGGYGGRVSLSVSLDGPDELHDPIRGRGRYRQSMAALAALLEAGVPATVNTVVTPVVLRTLAPFVQSLRREHPRLVGVTLFPVGVGPQGTMKPGAEAQSLSPEELVRLARLTVLLDRTCLPVTVSTYPVINPLLLAYGYPASRLYRCTAGEGRACVHADLTVSTCHPVKEPVYGRWRSGLFRELPLFADHEKFAARDYEGCRSCEHQEVCGHCRAFVTAAGQPLYGNDGICIPVLDAGLPEGRFPSRTGSQPRGPAPAGGLIQLQV